MDYVRVAVYQLNGSADDATKLARDGMMPIFRKQQGFVTYEFIVAEDGKSVVSFSRWSSKRAAEQAARSAADFVRDRAAGLLTVVSSYVGRVAVEGGAPSEGARLSSPSHPA